MVGRARRERIRTAFDRLHDAVGGVVGAADRLRDGTAQAHAEAMAEMWLRREGLDGARADPGLRAVLGNPRLADVVARVEADRTAAFDGWLSSGPAALAALVAATAPGPAGLPADEWIGEEAGESRGDTFAELWRIGTGTVGGSGPEFPVAVPLLDESHLRITSTAGTRAAAEALVEALLLRIAMFFQPGIVQLHVWDVAQFSGTVPGLYPLTRTGLLTVHDPGDLAGLLAVLSDRIRRVHAQVLVGGQPSLKAHYAGKPRNEPWTVAVLAANRQAVDEESHRQLQRVLRGGLAAGVQLILLDLPTAVAAPVETITFHDGGTATTSMTGPYVVVRPDPPLPRDRVTAACGEIARKHEEIRTSVGTFRDLLPERQDEWGDAVPGGSTTGLTAPIGFTDGLPATVTLADPTPHALVGGPSGSGKTNLLLTLITSLAARYSPRDLEFYLLDFKEGVSFARFAPGRRDPTWLPHAKLIGININTDREFGLALLQFLAEEMRRRADACKAQEVTKLEELRAVDPEGRWPRIVAVVDEFQYLFAERDAVTRQATQLLEDISRRGRSQGIHLVLATQEVTGIEALWGRQAIFEQFVVRIALPRARLVLDKFNEASLALPRWHAVVNHESGITHGNQVVRLPDATGPEGVDLLQRVLHQRFAEAEPRLFDASRAPRFDQLVAAAHLDRGGTAPPRALVGQCIDVEGSGAVVPLPAVPGRNLAVVGPGGGDAMRVLGAAAASLGRQHARGTADFVLAPLVAEAVKPAEALATRLTGDGHEPVTVQLDRLGDRLVELAKQVTDRLESGDRRPLHLVLYAADSADAVLDRVGTEALKKVIRFGPENGVHVLGWWRTVHRLKALLTIGASIDDLGAFVALDVQGGELGALVAPGTLLTWSPRPGRGLLFDRARHARPDVVIVPALEEL